MLDRAERGRGVAVTGVGLISPLGDRLADFHEAAVAGRSGLKPIELFETAGLPCRHGGEVRPFEPERYLGERNLRPLDRTSRLLTSAAARALEDAGWSAEARAGHEIGLVVGTTYCSLHTIAEFDRRALKLGPNYASPFDFANNVINAAAGQTAIWHGLLGVNTTLGGGEVAGLQALAYAADLIRTGAADVVLAGGVEELCLESALAYARAGRLCGGADGERPVPFDRRRNGFAPAEGAGLLVLEAEGVAASRGARILARIAGYGSAFGAGADRGGSSLAAALDRAVEAALADAGAEASDLLFVATGASGSPALDASEAEGLARALASSAGSNGPHGAKGPVALPVTAIKSLLGEALGASGAFQAASAIASLGDGRLAGIAGLLETDEGFPLAGASAAARAIARRPGGLALATGLSADGMASAVVLARRDQNESE
ncbi:MAG TPA: beta-ketoacyl synthase N-terminal-like domain-containing protein [Thermoanaerobaculia bacterium]|nr:beta-ketoacyl synthase N-terminal-like domain-containing protein [Thermoanaerobaculia bacterium]